MKFVLYTAIADWNVRHDSIMSYLGIPTQSTEVYAIALHVDNPESPDIGKYIFPVSMSGPWKCDGQFDPDDLVGWDQNWILAHEEN